MCHNPLDRVSCKISLNQEISKHIFEMIVEVGKLADSSKPGQFVNLYCKDSAKLLPRPISICGIDKEKQSLRLIYAVVGEGTKDFASYKVGETIDVLGPLGKGFSTDSDLNGKNILIVGGGVGTPPLLELAKSLRQKYSGLASLTTVLGFRDEIYLSKEFESYSDTYVSTDSGKYGYKGNVIELMNDKLQDRLETMDYVYSCGPTPMLKGLQAFMTDKELKGEFSLEERMGCGFGGCVGCVVGIRKHDIKAGKDQEFDYKKVCKDGPVFDYREVIF